MGEKLQITIIGLDIVGRSAGLALRRYQDKLMVTGHDRTPSLAAQAKSSGAVDKTEWNLISAIEHADRILIALPIGEIRDTLAAIASDLQDGCVIVDTASVKGPILEWGDELLRPGVHLVGGHPILLLDELDPEKATASLFENRLFCLTPSAKTDHGAVRLAADLVEALGARPYFMDPVEHDGMMAAAEHLPAVVAAALLSATSSGVSWKDLRRLAGSQYYSSTMLLPEDAKAVISTLGANRAHVVRWLDQLMAELESWRRALASSEDEKLTSDLGEALEARAAWIAAHLTGRWEEGVTPPDLPTTGTFMRSLIGFGRLKSPSEKKTRR